MSGGSLASSGRGTETRLAEPFQEGPPFDVRVYVGMLFFRWQIIALCFLYFLLGGVIYLQLTPKLYRTYCRMLIYRDPDMQFVQDNRPLGSLQAHTYLLTSDKLRGMAAKKLLDEWGTAMGGLSYMGLWVDVGQEWGAGPTLFISTTTPNSAYARAFLSVLVEEHVKEWQSVQMEAAVSASKGIEEELSRLDEKIRAAEDDLIEYQRLHDIARLSARGSLEATYLYMLMGRRLQLSTELMMLESTTPVLKGENASIIGEVYRLTRETGALDPFSVRPDGDEAPDATALQIAKASVPGDAAEDAKAKEGLRVRQEGHQELRVRLANLRKRERELASNMKPENPQLKAVRDEISAIEGQLEVAAQVELEQLRDRHQALTIELKALESAEYRWQAKNLLAMQRQAELNRIASVVTRYEGNYNTLYGRLHDMRIAEELKSEHIRIIEPVTTSGEPVWPDPMKILMMVVVMGLGSGFGLAIVMQVLDNKVQSIRDVESVLGIPFLGGVPFWVHSGLEKGIRPIVTEEHAAGAVEAYRALRTAVLAAMGKLNEKVLLVTSADSREGKTLTALNLAIVIAQMNKRVLLVDMDLRRGRLHRSLGLEREPGMTDVLGQGLSLKSAVQQTRVENLWLVPTGASADNSAELLQSRDLREILSVVLDDYDYIIMDTSPVLRVTDTVIVASQRAGVVLYVARVNRTPKPMIRYSLDMLADARVIGLIMNSIEMHRISSLYYAYQYPNYAYYSNAYVYGYDYYTYGDGNRLRRRPRRRTKTLSRRVESVREWARRTFLPME